MSATADLAPSDQAVALYTCAAWPELWEDDRLLLPALARHLAAREAATAAQPSTGATA